MTMGCTRAASTAAVRSLRGADGDVCVVPLRFGAVTATSARLHACCCSACTCSASEGSVLPAAAAVRGLL